MSLTGLGGCNITVIKNNFMYPVKHYVEGCICFGGLRDSQVVVNFLHFPLEIEGISMWLPRIFISKDNCLASQNLSAVGVLEGKYESIPFKDNGIVMSCSGHVIEWLDGLSLRVRCMDNFCVSCHLISIAIAAVTTGTFSMMSKLSEYADTFMTWSEYSNTTQFGPATQVST